MKTRKRALEMGLAAIVAVAGMAVSTQAQSIQKFQSPTAAGGDRFGYVHEVTNTVAMIGAPRANSSDGQVHYYQQVAGSWVHQQAIDPPTLGTGGEFGFSLAFDGDWLVVGEYAGNGAHVYLYDSLSNSWIHHTSFTGGGHTFGDHVAIQGDLICIGEAYAAGKGRVEVFQFVGGAWTSLGQLAPTNMSGSAHFGVWIEFQGDYLFVCGYKDDTYASDAGSIEIFVKDLAAPQLYSSHQFLSASDAASGDRWAITFDVEGDWIAVGCSNRDSGGMTDTGAVYMFQRDPTTNFWSETQIIEPTAASGYQNFGRGVAVEGNSLIVGSPNWDTFGVDSGSVFHFRYDGASWSLQSEFRGRNTISGDSFGSHPAISNGVVFAGAPAYAGVSPARVGQSYTFPIQGASATFRNDAGNANPAGFTADPPVVGNLWTSSVDNGVTATNLMAGISGYATPLSFYLPAANGTILVNIGDPMGELLGQLPLAGTGLVSFGIQVPADLTLIGFQFSAQGYGFGGGPVTLHNAQDLTLGIW